MIRDQALAVSDLLANRDGGPSVMPPQPGGVGPAPYGGGWKWITAEGPDRFRRALYTYWKRTSPFAGLMIFDTPMRDVCTTQRITTNTPLQPLVTLNDPAYIEMARSLAQKMEQAPGSGPREKLAFGYLLATQNQPTDNALDVLTQLREDLVTQYAVSGPKPLADTPDQAAMINLASVLLNLDTALTK